MKDFLRYIEYQMNLLSMKNLFNKHEFILLLRNIINKNKLVKNYLSLILI